MGTKAHRRIFGVETTGIGTSYDATPASLIEARALRASELTAILGQLNSNGLAALSAVETEGR